MTSNPLNVVMIDGQVVTSDRAVVSVYDRGFLYGDSIFEVMRTYDRRVFALQDHVERLFESARRVHIEIPITPEQSIEEINRAVQAAGESDCMVRVHVTRGTGPWGLDPTTATNPLRVVMVQPLVLPPPEDYANGISVALVHTARTADNTPAAGAKVTNYLVSLLALKQAHEAGAKEAIIIDGRGRVLEGTSSNVFLVNHGVLLTPPESEGILPGITRKYVLRAAEALGMPIRITTLCRGDLLTADEVFVSSTLRELLPVVQVDGVRVGQGTPGEQIRRLHEAFRKVGGLSPRPTSE